MIAPAAQYASQLTCELRIAPPAAALLFGSHTAERERLDNHTHLSGGRTLLSEEKMSEAEVSVRLALFLLRSPLVESDVDVAIDGAQVQTGGTVHFPLADFLVASGCPSGARGWQGRHEVKGCRSALRIHSTPGRGDVVAKLRDGRTLRAECKKGPLTRNKSSQEYPLLREALGQLLTVERVEATDVLAVVVPASPKFNELTSRWRGAPLVRRLGLQLVTVDRDGAVSGLDLTAV
jgi:hypothetical protein